MKSDTRELCRQILKLFIESRIPEVMELLQANGEVEVSAVNKLVTLIDRRSGAVIHRVNAVTLVNKVSELAKEGAEKLEQVKAKLADTPEGATHTRRTQ